MESNFEGKKILITGAGQGIGRVLCQQFYKLGAKVYALSRTQGNLETLKAECPSVQTICYDLFNIGGIRESLEPHLPFHYLVNNAGVAFLEPFVDVTEEAYDKCMNVNVKSLLFLSQTVCKSMISNGIKGSVVHISSVASFFAVDTHTVYCTSKAAVDMICKMMALELGPHGIRVNCVNPTLVLTAMGKRNYSDPEKRNALVSRLPMGKLAEIEDVTKAVMFLLSEEASMTTGSTFKVDGGQTAQLNA